MKKLLIIAFVLAMAYLYTHAAIPSMPVGPAPMKPEQVGIQSVQNVRIVPKDGTTAKIEINDPDNNRKATFTASFILVDNSKVNLMLYGCVLIDTMSPAFMSLPSWAANKINKALGNSHYGVLSPSGTVYTTNLGFTEGGSGWTPGYLTYSNYLGNASITPKSNRAGVVNLVNICDGPCQPKQY
ncbi:MAG: hypothetical protein ACHQVS_05305 [Candidatus Babeliales bacterium]